MLTVFSQNMEFFMERNMMVSVTVLAVFIARLMLSKIPKKYSYALWSVVAVECFLTFGYNRLLVCSILLIGIKQIVE